VEDELLCLASCYAAPIRCACVAGVAEVWSRVSGTVGRVLGGSLASRHALVQLAYLVVSVVCEQQEQLLYTSTSTNCVLTKKKAFDKKKALM